MVKIEGGLKIDCKNAEGYIVGAAVGGAIFGGFVGALAGWYGTLAVVAISCPDWR